MLYVWDWHTASQRQYVLKLNGRGETELAGGQKSNSTLEDILAEDVIGNGHITRSNGPEDMVLLIVSLATPQCREVLLANLTGNVTVCERIVGHPVIALAEHRFRRVASRGHVMATAAGSRRLGRMQ
jgi:hypothetical protein